MVFWASGLTANVTFWYNVTFCLLPHSLTWKCVSQLQRRILSRGSNYLLSAYTFFYSYFLFLPFLISSFRGEHFLNLPLQSIFMVLHSNTFILSMLYEHRIWLETSCKSLADFIVKMRPKRLINGDDDDKILIIFIFLRIPGLSQLQTFLGFTSNLVSFTLIQTSARLALQLH